MKKEKEMEGWAERLAQVAERKQSVEQRLRDKGLRDRRHLDKVKEQRQAVYTNRNARMASLDRQREK